ncbi:MAG: hypothetical protein O4805_24995 [Trichodesmium sp. St16_bin2-tuft]|nr:hypothetical protein [Trichodesmium sp. St16_bin2-tuft]MDE5120079.1 hypothetical protein [Trichodesmium sp. St19_bin1]
MHATSLLWWTDIKNAVNVGRSLFAVKSSLTECLWPNIESREVCYGKIRLSGK